MTKSWVLLGMLTAVLLGCKLMQPSPEKVCAKASKLGLESGSADCTEKLTEMQSKHPASYKCASGCINSSSDKAAANVCMAKCPAPGEATAEGSADEASKVDALTMSKVKAHALALQQNMTVVSEKSNSAGETVTVSCPATEHLAGYAYKAILVDIASSSEGYESMKSFEASAEGNTSYVVGNKKALFIECWRDSSSDKKNCYASRLKDSLLK